MGLYCIDSSILSGKQSQNIRKVSQSSKKHKSKSGNTKSLTQAAKKKQQKAMVTLDYKKKIGLDEKRVEPEDENMNQPHVASSQAMNYKDIMVMKKEEKKKELEEEK